MATRCSDYSFKLYKRGLKNDIQHYKKSVGKEISDMDLHNADIEDTIAEIQNDINDTCNRIINIVEGLS